MKIYFFIIGVFFLSEIFSQDCEYSIEKEYLNENILSFYLDYFSTNNLTNEVNLFKYRIIRSSDCINEILNIEFSFNIFSSELGFSTFELFYRGSLDIDINKEIEYFKSSDFSFSSG